MHGVFICQLAELVAGLENHVAVKIASNAEARHFLALTSDGCVFSWGDGEDGQLGHGDLRYVCFLLVFL